MADGRVPASLDAAIRDQMRKAFSVEWAQEVRGICFGGEWGPGFGLACLHLPSTARLQGPQRPHKHIQTRIDTHTHALPLLLSLCWHKASSPVIFHVSQVANDANSLLVEESAGGDGSVVLYNGEGAMDCPICDRAVCKQTQYCSSSVGFPWLLRVDSSLQ